MNIFSDLFRRYRSAFQQMEPYAGLIWLAFYLASFTSFFVLIPWAGFLVLLLEMRKGVRRPALADLMIPFDQFVPLAILFILLLMLGAALGVFSLLLLAFGGFLHQIFRLAFLFAALPVLIAGVTYSILLICDKKIDAVSSLRTAFQMIQKNPREHYALGLGALLLSFPCLIGAPIGCNVLVAQYQKDFADVSV